MTAVVGVLCRDGVVIGADSSATFTSDGIYRTIEQPTEKIGIVAESVIVAGSGAIGFNQRFSRIVEVAHEDKIFASEHIEASKQLAKRAIEDFMFTHSKPGTYGALVGFSIQNQPYLCEFAITDFQPEFKDKGIWYVSMGSGQPITDPFLALMRSVFWKDGLPTVQDATFAVTWTLDHAIEVNPGGIKGPIRVAVLERNAKQKGKLAARILEESELEEHKENISAAKDQLSNYPISQKPSDDAPDVPKRE